MLDDLGLLPALLWFFERYESQTGVHVDLKHSGLEQRLAPSIETAAYRIVQEALTNVARHSGVSEVQVRLLVREEQLTVSVEDQGAGFEPEAVSAMTSSGLTGMRERVFLAQGQLTIQSAKGAGTRILAELPLSDLA
jgi:signal transduction histidine kinase